MEQFIEFIKALGGLGICCIGVFFILSFATLSQVILMILQNMLLYVIPDYFMAFILAVILYCLPSLIYFSLKYSNKLPEKYDNEWLMTFFIAWIISIPLSFLDINWGGDSYI